jgi:hypothetical protein
MKIIFTFIFVVVTSYASSQVDITNRLTNYIKENYKIQYPNTWTIDTSRKMGAEFFIYSPKENENDKFRENVNFIIQDLNGQNIDLDKYAQITEQQIKDLATDGKIYDSQKIKTAESEYYKMTYGMTQGIFKLKIEQYYFIKDEKAFVITFTSELDKFEAFKSVGEQILNSFKLTK